MTRFLLKVIPIVIALGLISTFKLRGLDAWAVWVAVLVFMVWPMTAATRGRRL